MVELPGAAPRNVGQQPVEDRSPPLVEVQAEREEVAQQASGLRDAERIRTLKATVDGVRGTGFAEECRRVASNQAKMVFSVISIATGLSDADHEAAAAGGPTFIETPMDYAEMLALTGWTVTARGDVTAEYSETFGQLFGHEKANIDEFERVHGTEGAAELMARRERTLEALERDLLRREIFSAVPG